MGRWGSGQSLACSKDFILAALFILTSAIGKAHGTLCSTEDGSGLELSSMGVKHDSVPDQDLGPEVRQWKIPMLCLLYAWLIRQSRVPSPLTE